MEAPRKYYSYEFFLRNLLENELQIIKITGELSVEELMVKYKYVFIYKNNNKKLYSVLHIKAALAANINKSNYKAIIN